MTGPNTTHVPKKILLLDNYAPNHPDYLPLTGLCGEEYRCVIRSRFQLFTQSLFHSSVELTTLEMESVSDPLLFGALERDWDMVISSGSPFNTDDIRQPGGEWILRQIHVLRQFYASGRNTPFFGVCFGHQLLAVAMGGELRKSDLYYHGHTDILLENNIRIPLFRSHRFYVEKAPRSSRVLAHSNEREGTGRMPYIIKYPTGRRNMVTTQAHPELPLPGGYFSPDLFRFLRSAFRIGITESECKALYAA